MSKFLRVSFEEVRVGDSFINLDNGTVYTITEKGVDGRGRPQVTYKSNINNVVYTDNWEYLLFGNLPVGYWRYNQFYTVVDHDLIE